VRGAEGVALHKPVVSPGVSALTYSTCTCSGAPHGSVPARIAAHRAERGGFGGFACGRSLSPERTFHDQGDPLAYADGAVVADTNVDYKHVDQARVLPHAL
jgi:hypothetical protein